LVAGGWAEAAGLAMDWGTGEVMDSAVVAAMDWAEAAVVAATVTMLSSQGARVQRPMSI